MRSIVSGSLLCSILGCLALGGGVVGCSGADEPSTAPDEDGEGAGVDDDDGDGTAASSGATDFPWLRRDSGRCSTSDERFPATLRLETESGGVIGTYPAERMISDGEDLLLRAICGNGPQASTGIQFSITVRDAPGDQVAFEAGTTYESTSPDPRRAGSLIVTSVSSAVTSNSPPPAGVMLTTRAAVADYYDAWAGLFSNELDYPAYVPPSEEERAEPGFTEDFAVTIDSIEALPEDDEARDPPSFVHEIHGQAHVRLNPIITLDDGDQIESGRAPLILRAEF